MISKSFFVNIFLLLAFGLSVLFIKQLMDNGATKIKMNNDHTPDAYMLNAHYLRTNEQGSLDIILFSPNITHFKYQDTSLFKNPKIFLYKNGDEWQVTSKEAKGINGAAKFLLYDHVSVRQLPTRKKAGTILSTNSLTVFPKENLITTNELVTIEQPGLKITSIGLRGDLNTGNIKLLSKTRGQYDPRQSH